MTQSTDDRLGSNGFDRPGASPSRHRGVPVQREMRCPYRKHIPSFCRVTWGHGAGSKRPLWGEGDPGTLVGRSVCKSVTYGARVLGRGSSASQDLDGAAAQPSLRASRLVRQGPPDPSQSNTARSPNPSYRSRSGSRSSFRCLNLDRGFSSRVSSARRDVNRLSMSAGSGGS